MKDSQIKPGRTYTLKGLRDGGRRPLPTCIARCVEYDKLARLWRFEALGGVGLYAAAKNVHPADQPVPLAVPQPSVLPSSVTELQGMVKRLETVTDPKEYDKLVGEIGEKTKALKAERSVVPKARDKARQRSDAKLVKTAETRRRRVGGGVTPKEADAILRKKAAVKKPEPLELER